MPPNSTANDNEPLNWIAYTLTINPKYIKIPYIQQFELCQPEFIKYVDECFNSWELTFELTKQSAIHCHGYGLIKTDVIGRTKMWDALKHKLRDRLKKYTHLGIISHYDKCSNYKDGLEGWIKYMYKDRATMIDLEVFGHETIFSSDKTKEEIVRKKRFCIPNIL